MATITTNYGSWTTITASLASLASSSTFVAGVESTVIDNSSNKFVDAQVAGFITTGTTPTVGQIRIYGLSRLDNTPTYPDVFDGTDSAETVTSAGLGVAFLKGPIIIVMDSTTSNIDYPFTFLLSQIFGPVIPEFWSLFIAHNTVAALNSTGGNHVIKYQGIKYDIA